MGIVRVITLMGYRDVSRLVRVITLMGYTDMSSGRIWHLSLTRGGTHAQSRFARVTISMTQVGFKLQESKCAILDH
jgi:hypothetical protein